VDGWICAVESTGFAGKAVCPVQAARINTTAENPAWGKVRIIFMAFLLRHQQYPCAFIPETHPAISALFFLSTGRRFTGKNARLPFAG
jgi:hypothetical protein